MATDVTKFHFELAHLGINQKDAQEAEKTTNTLADLFGLPKKETTGSFFVGDDFEVMKMPFHGELGHFAMLCDYIEEAYTYLKEEKGIEFDESTAGYTEDGKLNVIYFKNDIAGFRCHLKRR